MSEPRTWEDLILAKEIRKEFGVSASTLRDWRRRGLPAYRVGNQFAFFKTELVAFIAEHLCREAPGS